MEKPLVRYAGHHRLSNQGSGHKLTDINAMIPRETLPAVNAYPMTESSLLCASVDMV